MDKDTRIRFVKARAPKEIQELYDIKYIDFYQKYEDRVWSSLIEPISNVTIPRTSSKNDCFAFPFCKDMYIVNFFFEVSANDFYKYLNYSEEDKEKIKKFFTNMEGINCFRKFMNDQNEKNIEKSKTKEEIEEEKLVIKIKQLLP